MTAIQPEETTVNDTQQPDDDQPQATRPETAHPAGDPDARYEVAARFQDGEVFTVDRVRLGFGLFDDEAPEIVARRVGDDEWLTLGSGGEFVAEYSTWLDELDGDDR